MKNCFIKKLKEHPYAKAYTANFCDNSGEIIYINLVSYSTSVMNIHLGNERITVHCNGTYSATTRRHISWFLREIGSPLSYYDIKQIAGTDNYLTSPEGKYWEIINSITGEIVKKFTR